MRDFIGNPMEQEYDNEDSMDEFEPIIVMDFVNRGRQLIPAEEEEDDEEYDPNFELYGSDQEVDWTDDGADFEDNGDESLEYHVTFSEEEDTTDELEYVTYDLDVDQEDDTDGSNMSNGSASDDDFI